MKKYAKEFRISTAEQRSPQWYAERAGIPSASGLGALFDTLADGRTPSAKAKKYLKQLAFERKFGTAFERFDTKAMQDGRAFEDFAKMVYQRETGNNLREAYSYLAPWFVATPDSIVVEADTNRVGLLECKIVGDESFLDFIENSMTLDHDLQTQGQLLATGFDWVDYIIVNLKTRAYYIVRVRRNTPLIKRIYERLHEPLPLPELNTGDVKRFDDGLLREFLDGKANPDESTITKLPF